MAQVVYRSVDKGSGWPKINSMGYASWTISRAPVCRFLKEFADSRGLPAIGRKWDKVSVIESGYEVAARRLETIKEMAGRGMTCKQIASKMKAPYTTVYYLAKHHGVVIPTRSYVREVMPNVC